MVTSSGVRTLLGFFVGVVFSVAATEAVAQVSMSGTVRALSDGTGLYSRINVYDSVSKRIVYTGNTNATTPLRGAYAIQLQPGVYDFYVRAFGWVPIEIRQRAITADTVVDFHIDTAAVRQEHPAMLAFNVSAFAIIANGVDGFTLEATATADLGSGVYVYNEFGAAIVDGAILGVIELFDDGTHGDALAGDLRYSRGGVGFVPASAVLQCNSFISSLFLYGRAPDTGGTILSFEFPRVVGVRPEHVVPVQQLNGVSQMSQNAAAIVLPSEKLQEGIHGWIDDASRTFYGSFADRYDFLYFIGSRIQVRGIHIGVRNAVTGLGLPLFDRSSQFGSAGVLQSAIAIQWAPEPPLLHETMHRWANVLAPPIGWDCTRHSWCGHWGYSGVNGILGGFDQSTIVSNGDGTYSVSFLSTNGIATDQRAFAPLEMYLAGFTDISAVQPVAVAIDPVPTSQLNRFAASSIRMLSPADLIAANGERSPSVAQSQKHFRVAFVGVASRQLTPAELAYIDRLAKVFAGLTGPCLGYYSFPAASGGIATVDPAIVPILAAASALDVDGDGSKGALTDGLLVLRYIFGFRGATLVTGAFSPAATRSAAEIEAHLASALPSFDVDGNDVVHALTDGLLILRYLFGFRGSTLTNGAIGTGGTRTAAQIEAYMAGL